ncbi:MAG: hypothetical protein MZV70_67410 [Desulfobacterales bacterium]|nr:hypothetical protein [Desulfobacterales bacterium]
MRNPADHHRRLRGGRRDRLRRVQDRRRSQEGPRHASEKAKTDFALLDAEVNKILWTYTNLFPGCLIKSVDGIRLKKKFFWDQAKIINRHWLAANMMRRGLPRASAPSTPRRSPARTSIDFIEYRRHAEGHADEQPLSARVGHGPQVSSAATPHEKLHGGRMLPWKE